MNTQTHFRFPGFKRILSTLAAGGLLLTMMPTPAGAVSTWNPTLLVNTESFQEIDDGDGTTNIELRFGSSTNALKYLTTGKFQFTKSLSVVGGISGSYLVIDGNANITGALLVKSSITTRSSFSGASLRVSGPGEVFGTLTASGAFRTDSNITINDDQTAADAILTFGSDGTNETLTFLNTADKFQFSDDVSVVGILSGSALRVDGLAEVQGALTVSGAVKTDSNLTLNDDQTAADTILTFGSDGTNETITFLNSADKFQFSDDVSVVGILSGSALRVDGLAEVQGALTVSGAVKTDSNLTLNDDQTAADTILTFGSDGTNETITFLNSADKFQFSDDVSVVGILSGSALRIDGTAEIQGNLTASGTIRTDGSAITINDDQTAGDVTFTFGSDTTNETLKWLNTEDKFEFSDDLRVTGNISGSTLTVDGNITLHGVTYNAPSAQGGSNTFLKNDGAGNLSWATTSVGNGSGSIISIHPDYPGAIYFASGSAVIGQLTQSGGTADLENTYMWTTSRATLQDYWTAIRIRVPDNFSTWDPVKSLEFRYKTGISGVQNNHMTIRVRDTAGAIQTLSGGLASATFNTYRAPITTGTWTPKGYFTVYLKTAATSAAGAAAYAGRMDFNFETTTP